MASELGRKLYVVEWRSDVSGEWYAMSGHTFRSLAWQEMARQREKWKASVKKSDFRTATYEPKKEATND